MAAMGGRKVTGQLLKSQRAAPPQPLAPSLIGGVNLVVPITESAPIMERGVELPVVGLPIMREGFVTDTGFLAPSPDT